MFLSTGPTHYIWNPLFCRLELLWSANLTVWWPLELRGELKRWGNKHMSKTEATQMQCVENFTSFFLPLSLPSVKDDDKNFRRAPSWRKKFRPKDMRGASLGVSDTLPANFRVTSSSATSPSTQPKRSPMDGKWNARVDACACVCVCVRVATHADLWSLALLSGFSCVYWMAQLLCCLLLMHRLTACLCMWFLPTCKTQEVNLYSAWTLPQSGPTLVNTTVRFFLPLLCAIRITQAALICFKHLCRVVLTWVFNS